MAVLAAAIFLLKNNKLTNIYKDILLYKIL